MSKYFFKKPLTNLGAYDITRPLSRLWICLITLGTNLSKINKRCSPQNKNVKFTTMYQGLTVGCTRNYRNKSHVPVVSLPLRGSK